MSSSGGMETISAAGDDAATTLDLVECVLASDAAVVSGYTDAPTASWPLETKSNPLTLEAYSRLCVLGSIGS